VFYPDEFNGAFAACPDPISFTSYATLNIYEDDNAYFYNSPFKVRSVERVPLARKRKRIGWKTAVIIFVVAGWHCRRYPLCDALSLVSLILLIARPCCILHGATLPCEPRT